MLQIPYLNTPEGIKGAIIQPQVLNPNPQTFFETSLWRKEKLICLSKMRKMHNDESVRIYIILFLKILEIFTIIYFIITAALPCRTDRR